MLSLSAEISESSVDLKLINGDASAAEGDIAHGRLLSQFAEHIARRSAESVLAGVREQLQQAAGPEVVVDAAAVAANFQRMVRIADSTGIPLDQRNAALSLKVREELDLGRFQSADNTPPDSPADPPHEPDRPDPSPGGPWVASEF